jgi:hypothetical protein
MIVQGTLELCTKKNPRRTFKNSMQLNDLDSIIANTAQIDY